MRNRSLTHIPLSPEFAHKDEIINHCSEEMTGTWACKGVLYSVDGKYMSQSLKLDLSLEMKGLTMEAKQITGPIH